MQNRTILVTGFDPFGGESTNASWEAVKRLPEKIGNLQIHKLEIPTVFGEAAEKVLQAAEALHAQVILCVGQAAGRGSVTPERIGINIRDARIPDNRGYVPADVPVVPDAPAAYFATVPVKDMVSAIQQKNIPASVSNSAGTFVCNDLLYTLLHHFDGTSTQVGFIHIPLLPEQGSPSLPLSDTIAALTAAIEAC
jgi:pyroglutamyl-peptidase